MRRSGARRGFVLADEAVSLTWYSSFLGALGHMEKNFFGGIASYSFLRALAFVVMFPLLYLAPLLALGDGPAPGWPMLLLVLALYLAGSVAGRRVGINLGHSLLAPWVQIAGIVPMARGATQALRGGGVAWRGTRYSLQALRSGRRVGLL